MTSFCANTFRCERWRGCGSRGVFLLESQVFPLVGILFLGCGICPWLGEVQVFGIAQSNTVLKQKYQDTQARS
eukprot:8149994-Heterocapsa_arctica.AAC.1